ncbi:MAG: PilZ domain-containing protein [Pseudomonadota bacterium]
MAAVIPFFSPRRRLHRRVPLDVAVALVHESGTVGSGLGRNISVSGVQVQCHQLTVDSLYRSDLVIGEESSLVHLHFMLPTFSFDAKVDAVCKPIYRHDSGDGTYLLGLEFDYLPEPSRLQVQRYVQSLTDEV